MNRVTVAVLLLALLGLAACGGEEDSRQVLPATDETVYFLPSPLSPLPEVLMLGGGGQALYTLADRDSDAGWRLRGRWSRIPGERIRLTLDWEESGFPEEDDAEVEDDAPMPHPLAAFALDQPEVTVLQVHGEQLRTISSETWKDLHPVWGLWRRSQQEALTFRRAPRRDPTLATPRRQP